MTVFCSVKKYHGGKLQFSNAIYKNPIYKLQNKMWMDVYVISKYFESNTVNYIIVNKLYLYLKSINFHNNARNIYGISVKYRSRYVANKKTTPCCITLHLMVYMLQWLSFRFLRFGISQSMFSCKEILVGRYNSDE